jgi:hypothetical protein
VTEVGEALSEPVAAAPRTAALEGRRLGESAFRFGVGACTAAVAAFLLVQLTAWPPHEDEALALFVGRQSLGGLLDTVLSERGGAPLHFLFAWIVAHLNGGLSELRLVSALFAVASVPLVGALAARLVGRGPALVATALASASWMLLFHGVYGRMYSLFLLTSLLSFLALLAALEHGGRRRWALWAVAILLTIATHPYGALVLACQGVYVLLVRERLREAMEAFAVVVVVGIPFWLTDLVLAGRFDVGVGGGGDKLGSPASVFQYLGRTAGDFTAGYRPAVWVVLASAALGAFHLARARRRSALLMLAVIATPAAALLLARLGSATSPESRHLIFVLPFFASLVGAGVVRVAALAGRAGPVLATAAVAALLPLEVAWGHEKTPQLYDGEPHVRVEARAAAADWLARTSRPDDVLFGFDPLNLQAWERGGKVSLVVVPRADAKLALKTLEEAPKPLGRGLWIFDASDTNNYVPTLEIPLRLPEPPAPFEARAWGPFLVVRTLEPTRTVRRYLKLARQAQLVGKSLYLGDPDVNLVTVLQASGRLARQERALSSRSTVSR